MNKRLYRSRKNRVFLGVCGGIAEYFNVEPVIVRLLFILLIFFTGPFLPVLYFLAAIVIPEEPLNGEKKEDIPHNYDTSRNASLLGWVLLAIGVYFLFKNLGIFFIPFTVAIAIILIILGILMLIRIR